MVLILTSGQVWHGFGLVISGLVFCVLRRVFTMAYDVMKGLCRELYYDWWLVGWLAGRYRLLLGAQGIAE